MIWSSYRSVLGLLDKSTDLFPPMYYILWSVPFKGSYPRFKGPFIFTQIQNILLLHADLAPRPNIDCAPNGLCCCQALCLCASAILIDLQGSVEISCISVVQLVFSCLVIKELLPDDLPTYFRAMTESELPSQYPSAGHVHGSWWNNDHPSERIAHFLDLVPFEPSHYLFSKSSVDGELECSFLAQSKIPGVLKAIFACNAPHQQYSCTEVENIKKARLVFAHPSQATDKTWLEGFNGAKVESNWQLVKNRRCN